jgi:hypothetical protein
MSGKRYTEEFKIAAVKQVAERGHPASEVAERLGVGFYAWRLNPESRRAKEDKRLLVPIRESWLESGSVYGYRKVSDDLRELGEQCGINRVHRLMRSAGIRSQTGYANASTNAVAHLRW